MTQLTQNTTNLQSILDAVNALPEAGGIDLGVTGATVGQTVKISAVDENGVPTAWESVDFPSGGWRHLDTVVFTSDVLVYEVDATDCTELFFHAKEAITGSSMEARWKGAFITRNRGAAGAGWHFVDVGGYIMGTVPRGTDNLLCGMGAEYIEPGNNKIEFTFASVSGGKVAIYGR